MPRTKKPVRRQEKTTEEDDVFKKLDKLVAEQKKKIDNRVKMEAANVELAFTILLGSISNQYLQKTVGQLKTELHLEEELTVKGTAHSSRSASHDDGYLTENSSQDSGERGKRKHGIPVSTSRATGRRSRSADATSRKPRPTACRPPSRRRSRSVYRATAVPACTNNPTEIYRTPAYNKNAANIYPAITPKVAPHTPLTVLRQPRLGEMVVSMSGSPVMVPSYSNMQSDNMANCNIRLQDGTVLSLQPKQLRQSSAYIPYSLMDANVLSQLETLKDNLAKVVKMGKQNMK